MTGVSSAVIPNEFVSTGTGSNSLIGVDGNAFSIMGYVRRELRRAGNMPAVVENYTAQAQAGDYDHLLRVSMEFLDA
jgi:hypothetical protein